MPLYGFSLDVPTSPVVVAERLRAIVGKSPGLWESLRSPLRTKPSDPPFIGSVKGNSFRLCRNINYRNSFLPQIWGRILSMQNGARVKVVMFMHPLVFMFTLFWLGLVGYGVWWWPGADPASSYVALG